MDILFELFLALRLFVVPFAYVNYLTIVFALISAVAFAFSLIGRRRNKEETGIGRQFKLLVFLTGVYLFIVVFTPHHFIYTSEVYATALIAYIYIYWFRFRGVSSWFRIVALISTVIQMGMCMVNGTVFYLSSVMEKSFTSCIVFLMMCIEFKKKRYLSMIIYTIGLLWSSFGSSYISNRTSILLIVVFAIVVIYQAIGNREPHNLWIVDKSGRYFIISVIAIFVISFVWCGFAVKYGVSRYHGGLMDTSNYIRMNSNLYVLGQLRSDPSLLLFGYDTDIYDVMKLGVGAGYEYFNGLRVVQAHHSVLDVFQRCGLLFTIVYFMFIALLIDESKVKERNEILLPIFAIGMIMHSYFQNECLLMLLVTLNGNYVFEGRKMILAGRQIIFRREGVNEAHNDTS